MDLHRSPGSHRHYRQGRHPWQHGDVRFFLVGVLSTLMCNVLNNQPMTILFTTILNEDTFDVGNTPFRGAMFSLIMGSNLGANITLIGALAGIMWSSILDNRGITISYIDFAKQGLVIMPLVVLVSCGVLSAELCVTYRN